jgi:hypothetical protein
MNPNNYRPISVLSVIDKIFEKVIFDQMYWWIFNYTHNLLSNLQSGFRPLHSTLTALFDVTDQWYTNMDMESCSLTLNILLKKLSCYGVTVSVTVLLIFFVTIFLNGLLVKPGTLEQRNTGTASFRNTEHRNTKNS